MHSGSNGMGLYTCRVNIESSFRDRLIMREQMRFADVLIKRILYSGSAGPAGPAGGGFCLLVLFGTKDEKKPSCFVWA